MNMRSLFSALAVAILAAAPALARTIHFEEHTIATDLRGGYQVVAVDLDHDGKTDLIALASGMTDLLWFANPDWRRHVIASNLHAMINCAPWDFDGDGIPEIGIAWGFSMDASKSAGNVGILHHDGDPSRLWKLTDIDRVPASHRLRWADIDGSGKEVLINAPLTGADAKAPDYRGHTPLFYYRPGEWKRTLISDFEEGVVHGIFVEPSNGRDEFYIASFSGIHNYRFIGDGKWVRTRIAAGDRQPCPKCGASDIAVGKIGVGQFLAAIEPWHGNQVVVYREQRGVWKPSIIDTSILDGHTIATADFDGDGIDEIVVGFRGKPYGVYLYKFDGTSWQRQIVDQGGVSAASCAVADLDGDGRPDLACIGSATHNLKWYRNATR